MAESLRFCGSRGRLGLEKVVICLRGESLRGVAVVLGMERAREVSPACVSFSRCSKHWEFGRSEFVRH